MGKVYVVGNFKGGVGKTKSVTMLAYESAVIKDKKTLVVDLDPQGNATSILAKTGELNEISKNITVGFEEGDLSTQITPIINNLDLIASNTTFRNLTKILMNRFPIDVPPTISDYSDNAMLAADYCIIVLQTQELSLDGAQTYIAYMQYLADTYDNDLQVLGIIPCMLRPGGRVDTKVLDQAKELYGGNVLDTIVKYQERLKVYDVEGIHVSYSYTGKPDGWDIKAHQVFIDVLNELDRHEEILESLED